MAEEPLVTGQPTAAELWRGVEATVRDVLLPALTDDWARAAAVQLVGLARYAQRRPADPTGERAAELAAALDSLGHNVHVAAHWRGDDVVEVADVLAAVAAVLVAAVDDDGADGDEVRAVLRPIAVRHLDEELAVTGPLVAAFRGQLDE
ncbi:MAG: hypothetical protein R2694_17385 [Ilumatobacteraceae bacterium]|nr:hypothetical protein [Ilumatobacter sp.]